MKKIPTLYVRDQYDMRHVTQDVTPGCEWVLAGEGIATRKYNGTCVMIKKDGTPWGTVWTRREIRSGKSIPNDHTFLTVDVDRETGNTIGWEPAKYSPFSKYIREAMIDLQDFGRIEPGTYELCGPRVNGNPEDYPRHRLIMHDKAERFVDLDIPVGYEWIRHIVLSLPWEGIVWHHKDGRRAKIKKRDFDAIKS